MGTLRRIRDFKAAKDETSAEELRLQLGKFENNVSDMGDRLAQDSQQRLTTGRVAIGTSATAGLVVSPGQSQTVDTRNGVVNVGLSKPSGKDSGKFIVLIDIGGGANNMNVQGNGCTFDAVSVSIFAITFAALIFCDGVNYWRIRG